MRTVIDLSRADWLLAGFTPFFWQWKRCRDLRTVDYADIQPIPARVPGSVQQALRDASLLPDWNEGLRARECDWVENRHWVYQTTLPAPDLSGGKRVRLVCLGLDYSGAVYVNGICVGAFRGTFMPHEFDLTEHLSAGENLLQIQFDCPPRWLGQTARTSEIREWKPRFNYAWDWTSRLVQIGVWDGVFLEVTDGLRLGRIDCSTGFDAASGKGTLALRAEAFAPGDFRVRVRLSDEEGTVIGVEAAVDEFRGDGVDLSRLDVSPWWPSGLGAQPLYEVTTELITRDGSVEDADTRAVGFRSVEWRPCEGAPDGADPWLCAVNGRPVFLRGVNWTPIRPNFADVTEADYRKRLALYRDLHMNVLRVWGGAFLEKECFYRMCDEMGLLVWQEFPLSSSGLDNRPPEDAEAVEQMAAIAASYIERRRHHASLLLWCGGNELIAEPDENGVAPPLDERHSMLHRLGEVARALDPSRRYLATSPSGPSVVGMPADFGRGVNWDVHGPWEVEGTPAEWEEYWAHDDALFRSETGCPGASSASLIRRRAGDLDVLPATRENPYYRRTSWWVDWRQVVAEHGREPRDFDEYVSWSHQRQAWALAVAARACLARFPRCGGIIIWMGHDSFPCTLNTAIVDFDGNPKPAALALGGIFAEADRPGRP
jgi:beta-mannosidase